MSRSRKQSFQGSSFKSVKKENSKVSGKDKTVTLNIFFTNVESCVEKKLKNCKN